MGRLNKPRKEGYEYRSPNQTNARDLTPNLKEDVVASQRADTGRIGRGLEADSRNALGRRMQQEAGGRALLRSGARSGLASMALQGGYEAGRAIDEATGVGRKMVDKFGPMIDRAATGDRVTLTKEAQQRLKDEEPDVSMARAKAAMGMPSSLPKTGMKRGGCAKGYAKGGSVRGGGCEKRGKTKGRFV